MAETPNEIITEFLRGLPEHTLGNTAFLTMMILQPDMRVGPEDRYEDELFGIIDPASDAEAQARHSAAVLAAAAIDYVYHASHPFPTSAEMHAIADEYREKHGHESGHMRSIAERQDKVNADMKAARENWSKLRAGPLSLQALKEDWWSARHG